MAVRAAGDHSNQCKNYSKNTRFYSWGANSYGQLGTGDYIDQLLPGEITSPHSLENISIITGGGGHSFIVTDDGKLWSCGSNNKGQLGLGHCENVTTFTLVPIPNDLEVINITAGWDFSLAVTVSGSLLGWGSNGFGQLGLDKQGGHYRRPEPININKERVVDIAAGLRHSVVLTESGCVYCWGSGKKGQLGVKDEHGLPYPLLSIPTEVKLPCDASHVVQVVAGSMHTMALTDTGELYMWGCNKYGQGGLDPVSVSMVKKPRLIETGSRIKQVDSGWTHVLCLTESKSILSWGRGDYGQLGRPCQGTSSHVPSQISTLKHVSQIACGAEHNLAISGGKLYSWGWGEHGILGNGSEKDICLPQLNKYFQRVSFKTIGCGSGLSMALVGCD